MKITDRELLPKTHYPAISDNDRSLYLHDPKKSYTMQKKGKVFPSLFIIYLSKGRILGINLVRDAQISKEGLVQNKNSN